MKRRRKSDPIKIEILEGPEMTPEQFDSILEIFANWIIRDFERRGTIEEPAQQSGKGSQP